MIKVVKMVVKVVKVVMIKVSSVPQVEVYYSKEVTASSRQVSITNVPQTPFRDTSHTAVGTLQSVFQT